MEADGTVEGIQRRMAEIRHELDEAVDDLSDQARQLRDWRHYVRRYPWLFIAAGTGIGYLLVPRRPGTYTPDTKVLEGLSNRKDLVLERMPGPARSVLNAAVTQLSNTAMRLAVNYAMQRLGATPRKVQR